MVIVNCLCSFHSLYFSSARFLPDCRFAELSTFYKQFTLLSLFQTNNQVKVIICITSAGFGIWPNSGR